MYGNDDWHEQNRRYWEEENRRRLDQQAAENRQRRYEEEQNRLERERQRQLYAEEKEQRQKGYDLQQELETSRKQSQRDLDQRARDQRLRDAYTDSRAGSGSNSFVKILKFSGLIFFIYTVFEWCSRWRVLRFPDNIVAFFYNYTIAQPVTDTFINVPKTLFYLNVSPWPNFNLVLNVVLIVAYAYLVLGFLWPRYKFMLVNVVGIVPSTILLMVFFVNIPYHIFLSIKNTFPTWAYVCSAVTIVFYFKIGYVLLKMIRLRLDDKTLNDIQNRVPNGTLTIAIAAPGALLIITFMLRWLFE